MKLLINADDFGLSRGQNYGIIDCFTNGVVRSTTLLSTGNEFEHACTLAKNNPSLDLGIHLSLDLGKPILDKKKIPSLVNQEGDFKRYPLELNEIVVNEIEVYLEWRAQIEKALEAGLNPTHMDSHHHIHMMHNLFPIYIQLASEFQLAIRFHPRKWTQKEIAESHFLLEKVVFAKGFINSFYAKNITSAFFEELDETNPNIYEMMCHPAYLDQWILGNSSYNIERGIEAETLQSEETKRILNEKKIEVISFNQL